MFILEVISLAAILCLCLICTKSDLTTGLIHNKTLLWFAIAGVGLNLGYYGYFAKDLFWEYILNLIIISFVSLYLFYSHSFAGGDCKFTIVLAILYPARFYLVYGSSNATLLFALGFAIFFGYCYLLVDSLQAIITGKVKVTSQYILNSLAVFLKSYITATLYVSLISLSLFLLERYGIPVNIWISRIICMAVAWCVGRFPILKKKVPFGIVICTVVILSIVLKTMPFSIDPENYTLVLILLFCQMAIKTIIYETVSVTQLKKGMILSTMSSILMQRSITKGLPGVSTEDLRSRLTNTEIDSIRIWAKATHTESLTIVKKIPFAIFISIGFAAYFILWGILWL